MSSLKLLTIFRLLVQNLTYIKSGLRVRYGRLWHGPSSSNRSGPITRLNGKADHSQLNLYQLIQLPFWAMLVSVNDPSPVCSVHAAELSNTCGSFDSCSSATTFRIMCLWCMVCFNRNCFSIGLFSLVKTMLCSIMVTGGLFTMRFFTFTVSRCS